MSTDRESSMAGGQPDPPGFDTGADTGAETMAEPDPEQVAPEPMAVARPHDPLAVALANASLLSAGYLILGRRRLAVITALVTVALVTLLGTVIRSMWFEVVVLLWWVALIGHGWLLASWRGNRVAVRWQRLVALGVTVPVLLAVGFLRLDALGIERTVTEARRSGDCEQALTALDRVWLGHRVADAPLTTRVDRTVQACQRLQTAQSQLATASNGDIGALSAGFNGLASVLSELPGHEKMVDVVLDGFLESLPTSAPCDTVEVTGWLRDRPASNDVLDRSADVAAQAAPPALVGCGDELMATNDLVPARTHYQQLLDQYPDHGLTDQARDGVRRATLAIELVRVRNLLDGPTSTQPAYCSNPAKYSGADPYGKGTNRALFYGNDEYTKRLPAKWRATDATDAVLVVCADEDDNGTPVETCAYEGGPIVGPGFTNVTFHKIAIPVQVYELRTGKLVADRTVQIDGVSCPDVLSYIYYEYDLGPPSSVYVDASKADVRAAFRPLIKR